MTFIPTQTGLIRLEDSENCCGPSSQIIPAWNRATPRHVWNRFPGQQGILERREEFSLLVTFVRIRVRKAVQV